MGLQDLFNLLTTGRGGDILGTGAGLALFDQFSDVGRDIADRSEEIGTEAASRSSFRPFGITTGFGGIQTDPTGGYTTNLSPFGARVQRDAGGITSGLMAGFGSGIPDTSSVANMAFNRLPGLFSTATGSTADREADIYNRIRATQTPEEERRQIALNEQLAAQGRTGLRTSQFGGSPEQLALALAQEQAKNTASLAAIDQARAEQQAALGVAEGLFGLGAGASALPSSLRAAELENIGGALGLSFMPEQQLLATLDPAIDLANISTGARSTGAGLFAEGATRGLQELGATERERLQGFAGILSALFNRDS